MTALLLFIAIIVLIMAGYPVAFTLAGVSLLFAFAGIAAGAFEAGFLYAIPNRIYGILTNETLIAVPLFVLMGVIMQESRIADRLLLASADLLKWLHGGLGISVVLVGALLAASTGIVGATVTAMGLLSLPAMLKRGYDPAVACGTICTAGTLGQIIPPSIVLVLLGEVMSSAYQQAQLMQGNFSPDTVSVADLFTGAIVPGLLLVVFYSVYLFCVALFQPQRMPSANAAGEEESFSPGALVRAIAPPLLLIVLVLGSILAGAATPTEAASVGAVGAFVLALLKGDFSPGRFAAAARRTVHVSCMVFMILIGATFFSLVFRGFGGDDVVHEFLTGLSGGLPTMILVTFLLIFLLGFVLDFIEITFVVVPIIGPVLLAMGADPVWLGIMIAINLQTSFLTPPFGFSLFYLRGVAPKSIATWQIYKGVVPFVGLQLLMLLTLAAWPQLATWLPNMLLR